MPVTKSWHRSYEFDGNRKNSAWFNAYVLQCDHCGKVLSVTTRGPTDLELETGWSILANDECYCEECR